MVLTIFCRLWASMRQKPNYSIGVTYIDCFYNKAIGIFMTNYSSLYICITAVKSTCSKSVGKMLGSTKF